MSDYVNFNLAPTAEVSVLVDFAIEVSEKRERRERKRFSSFNSTIVTFLC